MANKRIFYAIQRVDFAPIGSTTTTSAHGVQSAGINTSFNLDQVFEFGQLEIYENIEGIPSVEISLEKVLDGYCPLYLLATRGATSPTLSGRSNIQSVVHLGIWNDTDTDTTSDTPLSRVEVSGAFPSSVSYEFPAEGNFSENCGLVGNDIRWAASYVGAPAVAFTYDNTWAASDVPFSTNGSGGIQRRDNIIFDIQQTGTVLGDYNGRHRDPDCSCLPITIPGITSSGLNPVTSDGVRAAHMQRISASVDLGRTDLFELGAFAPYHKYLNFPTEVTTEFECYSISGAMVSASLTGIYTDVTGAAVGCGGRYNLRNETIRIATCDGFRLYTGKKNKLSSVNYNGGDTGGTNATTVYSFSTFNDFTVMHAFDVTTAIRPTGANATTYLSPS